MNPALKRTIAKIKTGKLEIFIQILIVFILPVALIHGGVIPITKRVLMLVIIVTLFVVILAKERWTLRMLGVEKEKIKKYALPYLAFTGIMLLLIFLFSEHVLHVEEISQWWTHRHFLYLFFIVSLFQEVAYRGYLIPALGKLAHSVPMLVFANVLLFTFLHTIFPNPMIGLPVAFVGGVGFAIMYLRYPSLPLIVISHAALNFCAVLYGFFIVPGVTLVK